MTSVGRSRVIGPRRTRNPNYRSSIYQTKDRYWHGRVTIGIRDDGPPDRRHVGGKSRSEVAEKVRALERERERGTARKGGERWTVARWLTYWAENITHSTRRDDRLSAGDASAAVSPATRGRLPGQVSAARTSGEAAVPAGAGALWS